INFRLEIIDNNMSKKYFGLLVLLFVGIGGVFSQEEEKDEDIGIFDSYNFPFFSGQGSTLPASTVGLDSMVCAWPMVPLRAHPGQSGQYIQTIYFGEQVGRVRRSVQRNEGRNYVEVITLSGNSGWVHEDQFVSEGGIVTLLEDKAVFSGPSNVTATAKTFRAGELFILSDFQNGDWVELLGPKQVKSGWVKGIDQISYEGVDIKFAKLFQDALNKRTHTLRFRALEEIRRLPDYSYSNLEPVITLAAMEIGGTGSEVDGGEVYYDDGIMVNDGIPSRAGGVIEPSSTSPQIVVEKVVDMQTGTYYNRVTETGQIAEVDGPKRPKNTFWAYHKTAPVGSQVLLHLPEGGYVALEVVARLKQTNPASIGLGKKLLESVFGTRHAKWATFSYPQ
ncbi:MAG: SH3 domain-containing protein, partial [Bacteroidota bacterium]